MSSVALTNNSQSTVYLRRTPLSPTSNVSSPINAQQNLKASSNVLKQSKSLHIQTPLPRQQQSSASGDINFSQTSPSKSAFESSKASRVVPKNSSSSHPDSKASLNQSQSGPSASAAWSTNSNKSSVTVLGRTASPQTYPSRTFIATPSASSQMDQPLFTPYSSKTSPSKATSYSTGEVAMRPASYHQPVPDMLLNSAFIFPSGNTRR